MVYGYIYKIPFPNGKCYIGLTNRTIEERWKEHNNCAKSGDNTCLYNALRKYNMIDVFEMIEIDTAETLKELCEKEIAHIEIHNSHYKRGYGYNMTNGGDGVFGYRHTEESRQKCSETMKKRYEDPEARQKQSETMKKRYEDPEARQKQSEAIKKYYEDPEARQKNSEAQKKYYKDNPEARQKNSEAQKKRFEDPEARQKTSEAQKKRFEDPEEKKKVLDGMSRNKPFDVFKKDGTYIKSFDYQFEAREYLQKTYDIKTRIDTSAVLKGRLKSSAGFTFKYKE